MCIRDRLDVIKDEFERLNILEINSVQALLLFNIGENEVTAVSYTHLRAHETVLALVCRFLLEKKN